MKPYAFGVDIGGTTVKIGFFKSDGTFLDSWEIPTRTEEGGRKILPDIARSISKKVKEAGISLDQVEGVGVGVPGPVMSDGIVNKCVNLGWGVVDVKSQLSDLLDNISVEVANDANVAALGEQWRGGGMGFENVLMVTLGTGVGGGVIIGGRILHGANGAGGEIGHMKVRDDETAVCGCGKRGCLEQYASATGIVRISNLALERDPKRETSMRRFDPLTAKDVFDCARQGDAVAGEIMEEFGKALGEAIAHITCVMDPDVVVIGGGVSKAGQMILDVVSKYYKEAAFFPQKNTQFKLAVLGNNAGMYGAVRMIISDK
ncbi:MAG: ROK family glucokinase [Lachnospiraceae bacterium]|nr:ROK family glucokinase [Lachnospiraceae bacterium]